VGFFWVFSVSPTNKIDRHDITEIFLNMALITLTVCQWQLIYQLHQWHTMASG
jgi:hypothetical protein